jgi:hypothetical protein
MRPSLMRDPGRLVDLPLEDALEDARCAGKALRDSFCSEVGPEDTLAWGVWSMVNSSNDAACEQHCELGHGLEEDDITVVGDEPE